MKLVAPAACPPPLGARLECLLSDLERLRVSPPCQQRAQQRSSALAFCVEGGATFCSPAENRNEPSVTSREVGMSYRFAAVAAPPLSTSMSWTCFTARDLMHYLEHVRSILKSAGFR